MLDEAKALLAELQRCIVQTQIDEKVTSIRVCSECLRLQPIRDRVAGCCRPCSGRYA